jgi:type IV secretion system protein VirD4
MNRMSAIVRLMVVGLGLGALSAMLPAYPAAEAVLVCAGWACLAAAFAVWRGRGPAPIAPPAGAAWARWPEVAGLAPRGALLLGLWPESGAALSLDEESVSAHVLVLGPSGAGKTAGVMVPNVLLRDPARESAVVLDVKTGARSLWQVTAARYGSRAYLFCPGFAGSIPYNPLHRVGTIAEAQRLAALLVHNTTPRDLSGDAQVYASAAMDLAGLLFLHVQAERAAGGHTVGSVYRTLLGGAGTVRAVLSGSPVAAVRERAGVFTARERRVREAAVTGLLQRLAAWADPVVDEATRTHWDLGALGRTPAALYIVLPEAEAMRLQPLVAWLVADLLDTLIEQADRGERSCPVRVYLDEFRRFGYLAGLSDRLPTLRERGVSVVLGAQVLSQIEEVYGARDARTLVANTETKLIFRAGDLATARTVSAWLGQTTVPAVSRTTGAGGARATVRPYVRPLAMPDEVARLPERSVLVLAGPRRPFVLRQARYYEAAVRDLLPPLGPPPFPLRPTLAPPAVPGPFAAGAEARSSPRRRSPAPSRRSAPPRPLGGAGMDGAATP